MKPTTIQVELGDRSYPIRIGEAWIDGLGVALGEAGIGPSSLLVTDESVGPIWADRVAAGIRGGGLAVESIQIASGERAKSLESVRSILDFALERRCDRTTAIVALGGGVVGDVAGFAAAILLRGVPLVQVPTTLLAMVDASVGGKTGVNHPMGKNLIGAFKQPDLVAVDLAFLETLSEAEYRSGLAEVVKYGAIADARFFEFIEANAKALLQRKPEPLARAVARSCEIKAQVVAADELESGLRAILNFGHTFAHAFEATAGFGSIRHGEAVAMGMMAACRLGERVAGFDPASTERLGRLLVALGLPIEPPAGEVDRWLAAMKSDKKARATRPRFVVPTAIGAVELRGDIDEAVSRAALETPSPHAAKTKGI